MKPNTIILMTSSFPLQVILQSFSDYSIPLDFALFFPLEAQCITYDLFKRRHILGPHPNLVNQNLWRWGPGNYFKMLPG